MQNPNKDYEQVKFEEKITDLLNLSELYLDFALSYRKLFEEFYDAEANPIKKQKTTALGRIRKVL